MHVEGARCKLRYRIPRIGRLRQLRDRDVGIWIEAGEHLVGLLRQASLVFVPQTDVQRDLLRNSPCVLDEAADPVVRYERARCHLGLDARRNAEHERGPAKTEIRSRRFGRVVGFARVGVVEGEVAGRVAGEVAKALVLPVVHATAQRVRPADLAHVQLPLVVRALVECAGVVTHDLVEVAIEIGSSEVDSRQLAGSHAAEVTAGLAELIHVGGQPDSARRELLQTEALIRFEEPVDADLTVDHRVTGDASPGSGAGPRFSHPRQCVQPWSALVRPVPGAFGEVAAADPPEESIPVRVVVIETHAKDVASQWIWLAGVVVVVEGLLIRRRRILCSAPAGILCTACTAGW